MAEAARENPPGYLELLRPPGIPGLFAGALIGRISFGMMPVGVVLFIARSTGSFSTAGLAMAAYSIGTVVAGPARSWISVRAGHARALLMMSMVSGSALILLVVAGGGPSWLLIALTAGSGCSMPPFGALMRVGWSRRLPPQWVSRAFGLDSVVEEATFVVGPLLATGAVALSGAWLAVLAGGAVCLLGGLLMASAADRGGPEAAADENDDGGLWTVARSTRWVLVVFLGVGFAIGALEVAIPGFALESGHASMSGGLLATLALGSAIAALFYGRREWRTGAASRLIVLSLLLAAGTALMAAVDGLVLAAPLLVVVGVAMGPAVITAYLLADTLMDGVAAKTHAAILASVVCNGGAGLGAAASGLAITDLGAGQAFLLCGTVTAIATGAGSLIYARNPKPS
ncbi:MFS transporter [Actinomadura xylanilytica]|uniref:MFS transporter n=1 Tax=Actinomadura xylanilytica TaxID=887459 RepID=UPI00255B0EE8|nr:MFS transporter [Actinomadura xylanilytica]MDL4774992.1 MFS transporter [Actinomadura xylanilytica]